MMRPILTVALAVTCLVACDSNPNGPRPKRAVAAEVTSDTKIISFETMYGVEEAFLNHNQIRHVRGDELPWAVGSAVGSLSVSGHLVVSVRGIVFSDDPEVPAELRGINDETEFRALVSCLVARSKGSVETVNVTTQGFPATTTGDADIDAMLQLPEDCIAPIIFILAGSEEKWFAVMGAETSQ